MKFAEIKRGLRESEKKANKQAQIGRLADQATKLGRPVYAPEIGSVGGWADYDSPYQSFSRDFRGLYGWRYKDLADFLKQNFDDKEGNFVAVEMGGSGSKLFSTLNTALSEHHQRFIKHSIGIVLTDIRDDAAKAKDDLNGHTVLEGNIFSRETHHKLLERFKQLNIQGVDFIIERMEGGTYHLDKVDPLFYLGAFRKAYRLLNPGGIMLAKFHISRISSQIADYFSGLARLKNDLTKEGDSFIPEIIGDQVKIYLRKHPKSFRKESK